MIKLRCNIDPQDTISAYRAPGPRPDCSNATDVMVWVEREDDDDGGTIAIRLSPAKARTLGLELILLAGDVYTP